MSRFGVTGMIALLSNAALTCSSVSSERTCGAGTSHSGEGHTKDADNLWASERQAQYAVRRVASHALDAGVSGRISAGSDRGCFGNASFVQVSAIVVLLQQPRHSKLPSRLTHEPFLFSDIGTLATPLTN